MKAVVENGFYAGRTPLHKAAEEGHKVMVDTLLAKGADVKAVDKQGKLRCTRRQESSPQRDRRRAAKSGRRWHGKGQAWQIAGRPRQGCEAPDNRRKGDPAFAKVEGEKLRKAFKEATTVHVLSTRFNEPSEEVLAKWYKQGPK